MKLQEIETIHDSLVNGQRKQMTVQIDEYGIYDFFEDYSDYLRTNFHIGQNHVHFVDCVVSYHRIKNG